MIDKLIKYYEMEADVLEKTNSSMKKLFQNRLEENLKEEREVVHLIIDKCGEYFFKGKLDFNFYDRVTYGFSLLVGKKELEEAISNTLEFKMANLNSMSSTGE